MTVELVAVTGFLGAGKTTTIAALGRRLERDGRRVAIVTNDQGEGLVDTGFARTTGADVAEVTGGCFCCRFDELVSVLTSLVDSGQCDVVLAEAVGSCTDLQATVVRPMRELHGDRFAVAPLVTVLDPARLTELTGDVLRGVDDLAYLFERQLAEADVIVVNKSDTGDPVSRRGILGALARTYPEATVLDVSARTGVGLDDLAAVLGTAPATDRSLNVDYDRYARAEADLAWLNVQIDLAPATSAWAERLLANLSTVAAERGWVVGHVKVLLDDGSARPTKASLTTAGAEPSVDLDGGRLDSARGWLNARVRCSPDALDSAVREAMRAADAATGTRSVLVAQPAAFRPSYPRPTHRMPAAG